MQEEENQKRRKRDNRTLSMTVVSTFIGQKLQVELKSDLVLIGILDEIDANMNLTLGLCEGYFSEGSKRGDMTPKAELVFVSGRKIRYIHFPDDIKIEDQMKQAWLLKQKATSSRHWISDKPKRSKATFL